MTSPSSFSASARLRLLATSDIHASVLPFDYAANRTAGCFGLARTASLIAEARSDDRPCLLFDNGDFLQGTPLGDIDGTVSHEGVHPVIAAMNALGYDAVSLGNHEFNFGLEALHTALAGAEWPVVCANALTRRGRTAEEDETLFPPSVLLDRRVTLADGSCHRLRIGVLGLLPPQFVAWDHYHLGGRLAARDMVETAEARVPMLRRQGADIVVLLAHTGPAPGPEHADMENAALALARRPGIDAIIAGHSHEIFPRPGARAMGTADHDAGTFDGVPAVMPGYRGSHLGVIDLYLARTGSGWRVTGHNAEVRPVRSGGDTPPAPPLPAVVDRVSAPHAATLDRLDTPYGHTHRPIHSYLSRVRSDRAVQLVAEAKRRALRAILAGGPHADLPVLAATAPYHTGGRSGPAAFTDIPAGPFTLRHATDLCPFPNMLCAVRLSGAEILDWLERAASSFHTVEPGAHDQPLCDPDFPGHAVDTIAGLSYRIDLTARPLYTPKGERRADTRGARGRIRHLGHRGRPVDPDAQFAMAVTNYRAFGGGPYPALPPDRLIVTCKGWVRDTVTDFIRHGGLRTLDGTPVWSFLPVPGASTVIETGPGIRAHRAEMAVCGLEPIGQNPAGFVELRMPLAHAPCESAM
ncbi:bifunctional 2',3'-cyclic-nucleotide 2'-phosphodiesterase/3'-nucleotidase [Roseovarius salis]|uniref:bifunctional 2',3'-cyclic-nucleotide 2'-phosphodiesterase/3'-nucleotidase n=1 Tax=Roseovarius salis TaxID=3376063 RepID=UPI0037C938F6